MNSTSLLHQSVVADTRRWLEQAVIGLNLCPFAKAVHAKDRIHYAVSMAESRDRWLAELATELDDLVARTSDDRDTTLLMTPLWLHDFFDFLALLRVAERSVAKRGLEGVIQLASFHPDYQFGDAAADDITNFSNRAPYPTLQLLREASVERAVSAVPQAQEIYQANMQTLCKLGHAGWMALGVGRS